MRPTVASAAAALALLLGACAGSDTVAERTYPGLPENATGTGFETSVAWEERGSTFAVTTYGSSTCPPVATSLDGDEEGVTVTFEASPRASCTADLGPTTHVFALPTGATGDQVTVEVSGVDEPVRAVLDRR